MSDEKELERHNKIINKINGAKTKEELPKVNYSTLTTYFANNISINNKKISSIHYKSLVKKIIDYNSLLTLEVKKEFIKVLLNNYDNISEDEIIKQYIKIISSKRINYLLIEIRMINDKITEFNNFNNLEIHKLLMNEIQNTYEIKELPKVGISNLTKKILKAINSNDYNQNIKSSDIKNITNCYINEMDFSIVEDNIDKLVNQQYQLDEREKELMKQQIIGSLLIDETIPFVVNEIKEKEKRKRFIYKNDHEEIMQSIKEARRISQLPPNLNISTLTSYLNGNTTIYTKDDRIKSEHLKNLTKLLLEENNWDSDVVIEEIHNIANKLYEDKSDAFDLLYKKFRELPKTFYYVEEINYSLERQKEFIKNSCSNVNVYFIPNDKSPIEGGRFYNCYINRVDNLDLSKILPLNLDEIIPELMDKDSIEWYVQEYYDETFKTVGGIILNKDETIGNVNIFKPNDGKVGISLEEKRQMDEINSIEKQIEEKKREVGNLQEKIDELKKYREQYEEYVRDSLEDIFKTYEEGMLYLQEEMIKKVKKLRNIIDE